MTGRRQTLIGTISLNEFARRQTPESKYSHFTGSEEQLLNLVAGSINRDDLGEGVEFVVIPVDHSCFFSNTIVVDDTTTLVAKFEKRRDHEEAHIGVSTDNEKQPAKFAEIVLYSRDELAKNDEPCNGDDWEIISINASLEESEPMHPITMARNFLDMVGGTKRDYSPAEFAEAIIYWSQHTTVANATDNCVVTSELKGASNDS